MSNILNAHVSIVGVRSILWHKFGPEALPLEKKERTGVAGHDPEEWRHSVHVTKEGQLYIPHTYVFGCLRDAAKYHKVNRRSASTFVSATLRVKDNRVYIDRYFPGYPNGHAFDITKADVPPTDDDEPVFLDITGVRNPSTKARNIRYRVGASTGWKAEFTLEWDKTIVDRNLLESIIIDAGRLVGLGDGRSVGYGRFELESFEILE